MANINGIEIRSVKIFNGKEGYEKKGNLYLDKKKIGLFSEDSKGSCSWIVFDLDKESNPLFYNRVREYYRKNPVADYIKICKMSLEEYIQNENNLPVTTYEQESKESIMEYFIDALLNLRKMEQAYKIALKKGYSAIVIVNYIHLSRNQLPPDEIYYTNGTQESFDKVKNAAKQKFQAVNVKEYKSLKDFTII